jgi:hypothetical protein
VRQAWNRSRVGLLPSCYLVWTLPAPLRARDSRLRPPLSHASWPAAEQLRGETCTICGVADRRWSRPASDRADSCSATRPSPATGLSRLGHERPGSRPEERARSPTTHCSSSRSAPVQPHPSTSRKRSSPTRLRWRRLPRGDESVLALPSSDGESARASLVADEAHPRRRERK